jgi:hypothetical protein
MLFRPSIGRSIIEGRLILVGACVRLYIPRYVEALPFRERSKAFSNRHLRSQEQAHGCRVPLPTSTFFRPDP